MQQYLTYLCTDINKTGPSLVIFLRVDQFYVLRFLFCRVYVGLSFLLQHDFYQAVIDGKLASNKDLQAQGDTGSSSESKC